MRKAWTAVAITTATSSALFAAAGYMYFSEGMMDEAKMTFAACAFSVVTTIMTIMTRRRYIRSLVTVETIECFRLKRPGLDMSQIGKIVPKGKKPEA